MNRGHFKRLFILPNAGGPTYSTAAQSYFDRVVANGDSSLTAPQKAAINNKFVALEAAGLTNTTVDRLFADKYCYTEIQALTAWLWNGIGSDFAAAVNTPTFTPGTGWTHTGTSYISTGFNPSTDNSNYTLDDNGVYHSISLREPVNPEYFITTGGLEAGNKRIYGIERYDPNILNSYFANNCGETDYGFPVSGIISNYQNRRTDNLNVKIKIDGGTEQTVLVFSVALPNVELYRGGSNNGTPSALSPSSTIDEWLCYSDSSFDKDIIQTALAT